ncbi:MAG: Gfo/Idh/MocA family oxidoreductase [Clostridiales bacterium]|jgi:predicted dehydrogenase|nr:Gfo/Idh/MocA family oxidoreductase [Clostridiales bacterium]
MRKYNIGILGCGNISKVYLRDICKHFKQLNIKGCFDMSPEKAQEISNEFGLNIFPSFEEMLSDNEVDIIVNLTPPFAHHELNMQILNAGKNLFCEKPFALNVSEAEKTLSAASKKNLYIGAAPDTFLGPGAQTLLKIVNDGWIGKPLSVTANMTSSGVESWHPAPQNYYGKGGGPLYDMAGYYLSVIIALFGAAESVAAFSSTGFEYRTKLTEPDFGKKIKAEVPTHYSAILRLKNGVIINMTMSFDILKSTLPKLEIYGTDGVINYPDPNMSTGKPKIFRKEQAVNQSYFTPNDASLDFFEVPEVFPAISDYSRGMGILDLAYAIERKTPNRANGQLALHITEVIEGMIISSETKEIYTMKTECEKPAPLTPGLEFGVL